MSGSWLFIQLRAYQTQGFQLPFVEGDLVEEGLRGQIPGAGRPEPFEGFLVGDGGEHGGLRGGGDAVAPCAPWLHYA